MKIFISYRRDDSSGYAGRLFDHLAAHFGAERIFMDVDTIQPGEDFRKAIENAVGTCDVVLVMIGKRWVNAADAQGQLRLHDPADWVRAEIATGLGRQKVVIPVLISGAGMPRVDELPDDLKELAYRNAIELSDKRFQYDANQLIGRIESLGIQPAQTARSAKPKVGMSRLGWVALIAASLGLVLWLATSLVRPNVASEPPTATVETLAPTATGTETAAPTVTATITPNSTPKPVRVSEVPPVSASSIHALDTKPIAEQPIRKSTVIRLRQFELYSPSTSFIESMEPRFAAGPMVKTYLSNYDITAGILTNGCAYPAMESLSRIRQALRRYAEQTDKANLLSFIETDEQIPMLSQSYPEIARQLIPQSSEWFERSPADREAYSLWLVNCVGVPFPVFLVTIENISDQEQLLTKVVYRVSDTGMILGGESGVLSPEAVYVHAIDKAPNQEASLNPPFRIAAKSNASFVLQLTPKAALANECGLAWIMKIYFVVDEERGGVSTDEFQLYMSGAECGPK